MAPTERASSTPPVAKKKAQAKKKPALQPRTSASAPQLPQVTPATDDPSELPPVTPPVRRKTVPRKSLPQGKPFEFTRERESLFGEPPSDSLALKLFRAAHGMYSDVTPE